ncbi:MAG: SH3 domain-containing protein [Cytophagaceae bacterium]|nr:SH3 domain-containing protein [Cytophagaceae bacterium]
MLTRLSLIHEGLGNYTMALYFLDVYYSKIPDQEVLRKMDELASRYNLEGYDYNDLVFFISLYKEYRTYLVILFLISSLMFLLYLYLRKRQEGKVGWRPIFFMIILGAIYLLSNYDIVPSKGIVNKDAVLMSAPSAGSDRLGVINKGHRLTIRTQQDIWCKVQWHGQVAYIRENNVLFVR